MDQLKNLKHVVADPDKEVADENDTQHEDVQINEDSEQVGVGSLNEFPLSNVERGQIGQYHELLSNERVLNANFKPATSIEIGSGCNRSPHTIVSESSSIPKEKQFEANEPQNRHHLSQNG